MSDPRITDEAVEAAAHSLYKSDAQGQWEHGELDLLLAYRDVARLALEAALPHLAPQPVVDREALMQLLDDYAVGRYVPEDLAQHRAFMADAIGRLLNGGAK